MTVGLRCLILLALGGPLAWFAPAGAAETESGTLFTPAIEVARQRVVKLYGAGLGRQKGYGSGVIVAPDGRIVTVLSLLLEGQNLRAVLPDGRSLPAQVLARDEPRQLALLKVAAEDLPYFELTDSRSLLPGDWLVAAANPFKVAAGPEPVSISVGVLAARVDLAARHRAQDFPYEGPVLLTDMIVSTPGCAGGALLDADGHLVGVLGRPVISKRTNTWLNYALPAEEVARFLSGEEPAEARVAATGGAATSTPEIGIILFDLGGRTRPAYVERVRPDSPARRAGVRPNDLIVALDGEAVATCADYRRLAARSRPGQRITLVVKRGDELQALELELDEPED